MIFGKDAMPVMERYKAARAVENAAIDELHAAVQRGLKDAALLSAMSERMEAAHDASMALWAELQKFKLGD